MKIVLFPVPICKHTECAISNFLHAILKPRLQTVDLSLRLGGLKKNGLTGSHIVMLTRESHLKLLGDKVGQGLFTVDGLPPDTVVCVYSGTGTRLRTPCGLKTRLT